MKLGPYAMSYCIAPIRQMNHKSFKGHLEVLKDDGPMSSVVLSCSTPRHSVVLGCSPVHFGNRVGICFRQKPECLRLGFAHLLNDRDCDKLIAQENSSVLPNKVSRYYIELPVLDTPTASQQRKQRRFLDSDFSTH